MRKPEKALLFIGLIRSFLLKPEDFLPEISRRFGEIVLFSPEIPFDFSDYYFPEMGPNLIRRWIGLGCEISPEDIRKIKIITNRMESQFAQNGKRRLNLDPGYLTFSRIVLATTKDYSHRIYLGEGIYAEVTLLYQNGSYSPLPWTYPDYRTPVAQNFFQNLRKLLQTANYPRYCFT